MCFVFSSYLEEEVELDNGIEYLRCRAWMLDEDGDLSSAGGFGNKRLLFVAVLDALILANFNSSPSFAIGEQQQLMLL